MGEKKMKCVYCLKTEIPKENKISKFNLCDNCFMVFSDGNSKRTWAGGKMITIKELDNYCKLHNVGIRYDRNKSINGIYSFDYVV